MDMSSVRERQFTIIDHVVQELHRIYTAELAAEPDNG
jgi:hypothetical protein